MFAVFFFKNQSISLLIVLCMIVYVTINLLLLLLLLLQMVIPLDAVIQSEGLRQAIFRAPFLAPSPRGVSRVGPKEGCSVVGAAADGLFLPHSKSPATESNTHCLMCQFMTRGPFLLQPSSAFPAIVMLP